MRVMNDHIDPAAVLRAVANRALVHSMRGETGDDWGSHFYLQGEKVDQQVNALRAQRLIVEYRGGKMELTNRGQDELERIGTGGALDMP
jgi:hypothetical protein